MPDTRISSVADVYDFVNRVQTACRTSGITVVSNELENALNLGSSGLEILGAVKLTLIRHRITIECLLPAEKDGLTGVIEFVSKAYGTK